MFRIGFFLNLMLFIGILVNYYGLFKFDNMHLNVLKSINVLIYNDREVIPSVADTVFYVLDWHFYFYLHEVAINKSTNLSI